MSVLASVKPVSFFIKGQQTDPVYTVFLKTFRGKALLAGLICATIHLSIWVITSLIVKANYPLIIRPHYLTAHTYTHRLYFDAPSELSFGIFLWGIFIPILWGYYVSSGRMWTRMLGTLIEEKVVSEDIKSILVKPSYPLVSLVIAILVGFLYRFKSIPSEIALGHISFWFVDEWSRVLISLMVALNTYIFISYVLKTIVLSARMGNYLDRHGINGVHIFSADDCGGFGVVGNLAMYISSLAVLVGVWAVWYSLLPVFVGSQPNFDITVILIYMAYAILVPLLLYLITRPVHSCMADYKKVYKADVASRLNQLFNSIDKLDLVRASCEGDTARYLDDYSRLKEVYARIDSMPEWPISLKNFQRFTGLASLPGIIGFITFVLDMVNIFTAQN